jgi:hypothetical protein
MLEQATLELLEQVSIGKVPTKWLNLIQLKGLRSLNDFQRAVLNRLEYFALWLSVGQPKKLAIHRFLAPQVSFRVMFGVFEPI